MTKLRVTNHTSSLLGMSHNIEWHRLYAQGINADYMHNTVANRHIDIIISTVQLNQ